MAKSGGFEMVRFWGDVAGELAKAVLCRVNADTGELIVTDPTVHGAIMDKISRRVLAGLCVMIAFASVPAFGQDCEKGAANMSQVLACLYDFHQQQVDTAFRATLRIARVKDANAVQLLVKAEKSWEQFASDSCDYTAATTPSEIPEDARVNCWAAFADARIKVLNAYRSKLLGTTAMKPR